jgi:hypothetical protein
MWEMYQTYMWWSRKEVPGDIQANLEYAPFDGREGRNWLCRCKEAKERVDKGSAMVKRLTMCQLALSVLVLRANDRC